VTTYLTLRQGRGAALSDGVRMKAWRRSKMNHRSTTTRRSADGMLGRECLLFSVTSNNLIQGPFYPGISQFNGGISHRVSKRWD